MTTGRDFGASVQLNGKLFVMGGIGGKNILSSTEVISLDGSASQPGTELPFPRSRHCIVKLSTGKVDDKVQQIVTTGPSQGLKIWRGL